MVFHWNLVLLHYIGLFLSTNSFSYFSLLGLLDFGASKWFCRIMGLSIMDVLFNSSIINACSFFFKVLESNGHNAWLKFMGVNVILWKVGWAILWPIFEFFQITFLFLLHKIWSPFFFPYFIFGCDSKWMSHEFYFILPFMFVLWFFWLLNGKLQGTWFWSFSNLWPIVKVHQLVVYIKAWRQWLH